MQIPGLKYFAVGLEISGKGCLYLRILVWGKTLRRSEIRDLGETKYTLAMV